jgi:hypothetical protein
MGASMFLFGPLDTDRTEKSFPAARARSGEVLIVLTMGALPKFPIYQVARESLELLRTLLAAK